MILGRCRRRMRTGTIRGIRGSSLRQGDNLSRTRALRQRLLPAKNGHAGTALQGVIRAYESDSSSKSPASSVACVSQGHPLANQASSIAWNASRGDPHGNACSRPRRRAQSVPSGYPPDGAASGQASRMFAPKGAPLLQGLRSCTPRGCCRIVDPPTLPERRKRLRTRLERLDRGHSI